ncbi:hypothetical protein [Dickeya dianthicola]|uniref:hypothetical protein n=1 Tax=Dickeya dianthicola TaxID=204039 RepID=UPI001F60D4AC|nr:hypothetical protein [Dickeya dianthicola]MCI4226949.1 hypothetical protein [Dickeya dianthicola]
MALDFSGSSLLCEYFQGWQQREKQEKVNKNGRRLPPIPMITEYCPMFANIPYSIKIKLLVAIYMA